MTKHSDWRHHVVQLGDVRLHYVRAGAGEPVLLVHGWPLTWFEWHRLIPLLVACGHDVIAVDLRGAGDSSRPAGGYDSNTVAADLHALVQHLGIAKIRVVGHDNGGRISYAYAANYREEVKSLVFLESKILGVESEDDACKEYWHFGFHQEPDLAETILAGRERDYLEFFFRKYAFDPRAIGAEEADEFVRCYTSTGGMRAGFAYYRAFPETAVQSRELAKRRLKIPVLAYGGSHGMGETPLRSMRLVAEDVCGGVTADCGHYIALEKTDWLAAEIQSFHRQCVSGT